MRLARLLAIARKEAVHIRRDPRSLAMAFAIPMLLLFMYGYALTLDVDRLTTLVHDQDRTGASRDYVRQFSASRYFSIVEWADGTDEVDRALTSGRAQVALVIPAGFASDRERGRAVAVQALVDGSDSNTATIALAYLTEINERYAASGLAAGRPALPGAVLEARIRVWYNPELESKHYIVPGITAVIMMVIAALLTSLTVAREWEQGTMEQLVATPVRVPELVLGKLLPYFAIGLADVLLAVLVGTRVFGVPFRGSIALLLALSLVFLLGVLSLGILISIRTRSQLVASQVGVMATFLPAFLLSGFIFDIANLPGWLQLVTYVVPARYFVAVLKGLFLKGVGLDVLWLEAALLGAFAAMVTLGAMRALRKRLD